MQTFGDLRELVHTSSCLAVISWLVKSDLSRDCLTREALPYVLETCQPPERFLMSQYNLCMSAILSQHNPHAAIVAGWLLAKTSGVMFETSTSGHFRAGEDAEVTFTVRPFEASCVGREGFFGDIVSAHHHVVRLFSQAYLPAGDTLDDMPGEDPLCGEGVIPASKLDRAALTWEGLNWTDFDTTSHDLFELMQTYARRKPGMTRLIAINCHPLRSDVMGIRASVYDESPAWVTPFHESETPYQRFFDHDGGLSDESYEVLLAHARPLDDSVTQSTVLKVLSDHGYEVAHTYFGVIVSPPLPS